MYPLIICFIVANCVLTVFTKDNDDDNDECLWCCHHAVAALWEFTLVHAVSAARRRVAADLWTKPIGLNH